MKKTNINNIFKFIVVFFVLGMALCFVSGCSRNKIKEVDENSIVYTGESIKWDDVKNAEGYEVSINGDVYKDTNAVSYTYKNGGNFSFSIKAYKYNAKGEKIYSESVTVSFTDLGSVTNIKIEDGVVTWDEVPGANAYKLRVNGTELPDTYSVREYSGFNIGKNTIEIRAINVDNSRAYSVWTTPLQFELLDVPTNIKFDAENKIITWDLVKNAYKYEVTINGVEKTTVVNNSYQYEPGKKDFTVSVKAVGDHLNYVFDSDNSESKEFVFLPQVENLTMVDGVLVWNGSEKATGYKIKIDNILQSTILDKPQYTNIVPGESYSISILQVSDKATYYSEWSEPVFISICVTPQIRYEDGVIAWTGIANASGYKVSLSLNGEEINVPNLSSQNTSYFNEFAQAGIYKIKVSTLADEEKGYFGSKFSNEIEIIRLEKPSTGKVFDINTQINETYINFDTVLYAKNYRVRINGTESKEVAGSPFYFKDSKYYTDLTAESTIKVEIFAVGDGQSYSTDKVILDSLVGYEFTITKVATPTEVTIENSTIKWDIIPHSSGYVVDINGKIYYPTTNILELPEGLSSGEHKVTVRALGNGSAYISSNKSKVLTFDKLATPTGLEIVNGVLRWDIVHGAEKYDIKVGEYTTQVVTNSFTIEEQYISTDGTAIYVKALGNNSTKVDSGMSNTDVVIRLRKVNGLSIVEDSTSLASSKLVWNAVTAGEGVRVSYRIKVGNTTVETVTGTSYDVNNLASYFEDPTKSYSVTVQAIGNQKTYFAGEISDPLNIQKLATPNVVIKDKNVISWEGVINASKYAVYLNNEVVYSGIEPECKLNVTQDAVLKVIALGDLGVNTINSIPYEQLITVTPQEKPQIKIESVDGDLVTVKVVNPYHEDTVFEFNGGVERVVTSDYTATIKLNAGITTSITVVAYGGIFNDSINEYMLDSVPSSAKDITLLSNPSINDFDVSVSNNTYTLRYSSAAKAVAYELEFEFILSDGTTQTLFVERHTSTTYVIADMPENAIGFRLKLRALGNGSNIISALDAVEYSWDK